MVAFTSQVKPYLKPVDTFHASLRLTDGTIGTFNMSFGSEAKYDQLYLVGEKATLTFKVCSLLDLAFFR